ncbi:MAG: glycine--tRNA ligase subunit beta [Pseudomonadota bacterium]
MTESTHSEDCLIEIGMEELPPKAMPALSAAFVDNVRTALETANLNFDGIEAFAAPRRLALRIGALAIRQPDEAVELRGPPVSVAFDDDGKPTRAAEAFAKKNGVNVDDLQREETDKGSWLRFSTVRKGAATTDLLGEIVEGALNALPIPRRMRWGDSTAAFVRPVHWVVMLHGTDVVPCSVLGVRAARASRGHRFHANDWFDIAHPRDYVEALHERFVIADFAARRRVVEDAVNAAATAAGGSVEYDAGLLEEITALCDWPVAITGAFDERFLELPVEVLTSTLKVHQRYFPVVADDGRPMAAFITVANIASREPGEVRRGNERVIAPRLADAEFFWNNDRKRTLAEHGKRLDAIVYQQALGSISDKVARVSAIAIAICEALGIDAAEVTQASQLARCDLVTDMVGEFPELQGIMGAYYAAHDGVDEAVVSAIRSQYQPAFAGDDIPPTLVGQVLSAADRIDTLAGIFAIGKKPTGNRDPFGLRRAALGLIRVLIEGGLAISLQNIFGLAMQLQPVEVGDAATVETELLAFAHERARSHYRNSVTAERGDLFDAVLVRNPATLVDFDQRLHAVAAFVQRPEAGALAAANKRIGNLLRSADEALPRIVDASMLTAGAERTLYDESRNAEKDIAPLMAADNYTGALERLAQLRDVIDRFFDDVMVMADDRAVRTNRLALLTSVRELFLEVADISELASATH